MTTATPATTEETAFIRKTILEHAHDGRKAPNTLRKWLDQDEERFQHLAAVAVLHLRARNASPETFSLEVSSAQPRIPGTSPPPEVTESLERAVQSMYDTVTMAQQPDKSLETVVRAHTTAWLILNPTGQYPPALPTGPEQRRQHPKE